MGCFEKFELPEKPKIPERKFYITDYGAEEGGIVKCTDAVRAAMEACSSMGGGKVCFPRGRYLTGPIHLKSNIELHFEDGCEVYFSPDKEDYLPAVYTSFSGIRCRSWSPLIYGDRLTNVAVTGNGDVILDGGGDKWWYLKAHSELVGSSILWSAGANRIPVEKRDFSGEAYGLRPPFIQLVRSENVCIEGLRLINSPLWNIHPVWCKNVVIRNIVMDSPFYSPNTDGINIESDKNVLVEYCDVVSGGDDCFCLKSGRGQDGYDVGIPCENVVIRYCHGGRVNGGGIVIGSEMSGGVRNILGHDCRFDSIGGFGMNVKSQKGRGAYVKDIEYRNMTLGEAKGCIQLTFGYEWGGNMASSGDVGIPEYDGFYFENISCQSAKTAINLVGLPDSEIKNVAIKDISVMECEKSISCEYVTGLNIINLSTIGDVKSEN